ncbi:hypothetical protein QAD02_003312 [Eretmocerus hayati]|uniref:Uncharacterized protein n=1 Tax=Eretmocerus hayati TaxID=131215 RepID=A0ACC2NLJ9_9HYME|nr:hypothetical protein QAD02_003312 [Eretmocerus hayati]
MGQFQSREEQDKLLEAGLVSILASQLGSSLEEVQLPAMTCLANVCYKNQEAASIVVQTMMVNDPDGRSILDILGCLMSRNKNRHLQLAAARCVTYVYRANALMPSDPRVIFKALPCLIRICHRNHPDAARIAAAEMLAYLTEVDTDLQRLASITDHLIPTLAEFLKPNVQNYVHESIRVEFLDRSKQQDMTPEFLLVLS